MDKDIQNLLDISERIGKNSEYIALSGGNISLKINNKILIKGSGQMLSEAKTKPIFVQLDLNGKKDKSNIINSKDLSKVVNTNINPSIELPLHLNLPFKCIIHTHPIDIIALTILEKIPLSIKNNLDIYSYIKLPYIEIGEKLGTIIEKNFLKTKSKIFILDNHGIVIGHDTPAEAEKLHNEFCKKIIIDRRCPPKFKKSLMKPFLDLLPNAYIPNLEIIHSLATDPLSLELCKKNAPYPDHIVFCGKETQIIKRKEDLKYVSLVNKKWLLIEKKGVIILDSKNTKIQEMLSFLAEIYLRVNNLKNINLLSDSECENIFNKEEEKYRINMLQE